jgi:multiple sugar transport system substrate-binding protein
MAVPHSLRAVMHALLAAACAAPALPGAAAAATAAGPAPVQVRYMLWDSSQLPAYRQCARDFTAQHPGITVRISQAGWDDYWTSISMGFIAGSAPDVFTNHPGKYPQIQGNGLLLDLAPYLRRDRVDTSIYAKGLLDIWRRDGRQYGLPKDWDTVALVVNMDRARAAGVTKAELQQMTWNPADGGSFEQVMKRLALDTQGRNALSPQFDRRHVAVYGYQNPGAGGMTGQTEWSHFAVSNGFRYQDAPWSRHFHYDSPALAQTLDWLATLPARGLSAPYENSQSLGPDVMFVTGQVAMVPEGSWMIGYFAANTRFDYAWVPLPRGPSGRRATMLNGLADSIWAGSAHKEEAWQWVRYLGSAPCQSVVAGYGVVFPAIDGMAAKAVEAQRRKGIDSSAFLLMSQEQTFLTPIADHASEVVDEMRHAIESVLLGRQKAAAALGPANARIDELLK